MFLTVKIAKVLMIALIIGFLSPALSAHANFEEAKIAFDERRFEEAFDGFTQAAEEGHILAQYHLAVMYATGRTMERDDVSAYKWFLKAAEQGHPISQGNIGTMKLNSRGTEYDLSGAYYWFILAEDGGFEKARKFMWRVTNYMERDEINDMREKAEKWIKQNRNDEQ